jgi:hypothetical protein
MWIERLVSVKSAMLAMPKTEPSGIPFDPKGTREQIGAKGRHAVQRTKWRDWWLSVPGHRLTLAHLSRVLASD